MVIAWMKNFPNKKIKPFWTALNAVPQADKMATI
jgi:hypothetical protein